MFISTLSCQRYLYDRCEAGQRSRDPQANLIHPHCVHYCGVYSGVEMAEV